VKRLGRIGLIIALLCSLGACASAGTPTAVAAPQPQPLPSTGAAEFGQDYLVEVPVNDVGRDRNGRPLAAPPPRAAIVRVSRPEISSNDVGTFPAASLVAGLVYVSVKVEIIALEDGVEYSPLDFQLIGPDGQRRAQWPPHAAGKPPALYDRKRVPPGHVIPVANRGEHIVGYVTIMAPPHGTIVYYPSVGRPFYGNWQF
jgi:hypothetical protein